MCWFTMVWWPSQWHWRNWAAKMWLRKRSIAEIRAQHGRKAWLFQISWKMLDDNSTVWFDPQTLNRFIFFWQVKFQGLTNQVEFDNEGIRRNIAVDVAELQPGGLEVVGKWLYERALLSKSRFEVTRKKHVEPANKTLVVVMALVCSSLMPTSKKIWNWFEIIPERSIYDAERHVGRIERKRSLRRLWRRSDRRAGTDSWY